MKSFTLDASGQVVRVRESGLVSPGEFGILPITAAATAPLAVTKRYHLGARHDLQSGYVDPLLGIHRTSHSPLTRTPLRRLRGLAPRARASATVSVDDHTSGDDFASQLTPTGDPHQQDHTSRSSA